MAYANRAGSKQNKELRLEFAGDKRRSETVLLENDDALHEYEFAGGAVKTAFVKVVVEAIYSGNNNGAREIYFRSGPYTTSGRIAFSLAVPAQTNVVFEIESMGSESTRLPSFGVQVGLEAPTHEFDCSESACASAWTWMAVPGEFIIPAGAHTLYVHSRMPGSKFRAVRVKSSVDAVHGGATLQCPGGELSGDVTYKPDTAGNAVNVFQSTKRMGGCHIITPRQKQVFRIALNVEEDNRGDQGVDGLVQASGSPNGYFICGAGYDHPTPQFGVTATLQQELRERLAKTRAGPYGPYDFKNFVKRRTSLRF